MLDDFDVDGNDGHSRTYSSLKELWNEVLDTKDQGGIDKTRWYAGGEQYWATVNPSVNGVLGGLGFLDQPDIQGSRVFLNVLCKKNIVRDFSRAIDCGAGIGRVSGQLLMPLFNKVDLLEPEQSFIETAKRELGSKPSFGDAFVIGMQDFEPPKGRQYSLVWIQWVIGHLTDDDLVAFLRRVAAHLHPNGAIVIKDNTSRKGFILDKEDNSITRCKEHLHRLFAKAGLQVTMETRQAQGFPENIFPVWMFALTLH